MEEYMKKYLRYGLIVGLASVFALSAFAGCGGGENESSPSSSDSTSGNSSSVEDTENYEGYFKKMTITSGDLLVYGRAENLSTEQQFLAESIQGLLFRRKVSGVTTSTSSSRSSTISTTSEYSIDQTWRLT